MGGNMAARYLDAGYTVRGRLACGEQMTINVIAGTRQTGAPYRVMAFLYLPSLWSSEQVRQLQVGLARALGRGFAVAPAAVQVITSIVDSGHVVEAGQTQNW